MKRLVFFSLALISLVCLSFVNTSDGETQKDKAATKLLKEVSKKYKGYKTLKADFTLESKPADPKGKKTTQTGSLWTKGNKFKLVFGGQDIFCDGKYIWTYTAESNECLKEDYSANSSSLNPSNIFSIWEKGFLYQSDGSSKNKSGKELSKIKLTPTDKSKPYFLMNLEVEKVAKTLSSLQISFKAGNKQTYSITSQTPNTNIEDSNFKFDASKHPGVEVVDLTKKAKN